MSADNRICLMDWNYCWYGWHGSCSMNYFEPDPRAKCFETREKALEWAHKEAEDIVLLEGGITIVGVDEQRIALQEFIDDAKVRLKNLDAWGIQFPVNNDLNFR